MNHSSNLMSSFLFIFSNLCKIVKTRGFFEKGHFDWFFPCKCNITFSVVMTFICNLQYKMNIASICDFRTFCFCFLRTLKLSMFIVEQQYTCHACKFNDGITSHHVLRSIKHACKFNDVITSHHVLRSIKHACKFNDKLQATTCYVASNMRASSTMSLHSTPPTPHTQNPEPRNCAHSEWNTHKHRIYIGEYVGKVRADEGSEGTTTTTTAKKEAARITVVPWLLKVLPTLALYTVSVFSAPRYNPQAQFLCWQGKIPLLSTSPAQSRNGEHGLDVFRHLIYAKDMHTEDTGRYLDVCCRTSGWKRMLRPFVSLGSWCLIARSHADSVSRASPESNCRYRERERYFVSVLLYGVWMRLKDVRTGAAVMLLA